MKQLIFDIHQWKKDLSKLSEKESRRKGFQFITALETKEILKEIETLEKDVLRQQRRRRSLLAGNLFLFFLGVFFILSIPGQSYRVVVPLIWIILNAIFASVVLYWTRNIPQLIKEFEKAVDDYLAKKNEELFLERECSWSFVTPGIQDSLDGSSRRTRVIFTFPGFSYRMDLGANQNIQEATNLMHLSIDLYQNGGTRSKVSTSSMVTVSRKSVTHGSIKSFGNGLI